MNFSKLNQLADESFAVRKMITAASLKIFMNYSQTIAILNTLDLNWENKLLEIFNIHKVASGGFQEVISVECFFTQGKYLILNFVFFSFSIRFESHPLL